MSASLFNKGLLFRYDICFYIYISISFFFVSFQAYEYFEALFTIADGIYGSTFFMATGFHGLHVIIGSIFILISFIRHLKCQFARNHHIGFETAC